MSSDDFAGRLFLHTHYSWIVLMNGVYLARSSITDSNKLFCCFYAT